MNCTPALSKIAICLLLLVLAVLILVPQSSAQASAAYCKVQVPIAGDTAPATINGTNTTTDLGTGDVTVSGYTYTNSGYPGPLDFSQAAGLTGLKETEAFLICTDPSGGSTVPYSTSTSQSYADSERTAVETADVSNGEITITNTVDSVPGTIQCTGITCTSSTYHYVQTMGYTIATGAYSILEVGDKEYTWIDDQGDELSTEANWSYTTSGTWQFTTSSLVDSTSPQGWVGTALFGADGSSLNCASPCQTVQKFMQQLSASGVSFDGATTEEADGSLNTDTCYFTGSAIMKAELSGGEWPVTNGGQWGPDYVGRFPFAVDYYRFMLHHIPGRLPCQSRTSQFMRLNFPDGFAVYYRLNTLGTDVGYPSYYDSLRDGQLASEAYISPSGVPLRFRLQNFDGFVAGPATNVSETAAISRVGGDLFHLTVEGYRPVALALEKLNKEFGWQLSYEDSVLRDPDEIVHIKDAQDIVLPKPGKIDVFIDKTDPTKAVGIILADHLARRNAGFLSLSTDDHNSIHVFSEYQKNGGELQRFTPLSGYKLSVARKKWSAMELLNTVCNQLSTLSGKPVIVGTVPINLLAQQKLETGGEGVAAFRLLKQVMDSTGRKLVWQIFYDPTLDLYALNIDSVN